MAKQQKRNWRPLSERISNTERELRTTESYIVKLEARKLKWQERLAKLVEKAQAKQEEVVA